MEDFAGALIRRAAVERFKAAPFTILQARRLYERYGLAVAVRNGEFAGFEYEGQTEGEA